VKKLRKFETVPLADVLRKIERSDRNEPVAEKISTKREPYAVASKSGATNE
jgi:hypothetical protein